MRTTWRVNSGQGIERRLWGLIFKTATSSPSACTEQSAEGAFAVKMHETASRKNVLAAQRVSLRRGGVAAENS